MSNEPSAMFPMGQAKSVRQSIMAVSERCRPMLTVSRRPDIILPSLAPRIVRFGFSVNFQGTVFETVPSICRIRRVSPCVSMMQADWVP
jgi:hypothetical protein